MTAPPISEAAPERVWWDRWWPAWLSRRGSDPVVVAAAGAQVLTVALTWGLWEPRTSPPQVPLLGAASDVPLGVLLVVTAVAAAFVPRVAGPAHLAVLVGAVAGDGIRLQPEVVCLALLLTLPAFGAPGRQVMRWYLAALWTWAGVHKLASLGFEAGTASLVADDLGVPSAAHLVALVLPVVEVTVGLAALWRRSWPIARWGGAALHVGVLAWLSPLLAFRNLAVWPWNAALVVAALVLFAPSEAVWTAARRPVGVAVALLVLGVPAQYYRTGAGAYLSHHLYSDSTPVAQVACLTAGPCLDVDGAEAFSTAGLRVPFPPEPVLYRAWFDDHCLAGGRLVVVVPETRLSPARTSTHDCPPGR